MRILALPLIVFLRIVLLSGAFSSFAFADCPGTRITAESIGEINLVNHGKNKDYVNYRGSHLKAQTRPFVGAGPKCHPDIPGTHRLNFVSSEGSPAISHLPEGCELFFVESDKICVCTRAGCNLPPVRSALNKEPGSTAQVSPASYGDNAEAEAAR